MRRPLFLLAALALVSAPIAAQQVIPTVDCVEDTDDGRYRAYFGYETTGDTTLTVPLGHDNRYQGGRTDDEPETTFTPGVRRYAFEATFANRLTWSIRTEGVKRMVRADQRHPDFNACDTPSDSDSEPESLGSLRLDSVTQTGFNAAGPQTLVVGLDGATFAPEADAHRAVLNGAYLVPVSVSATELRFDIQLQAGQNDLALFAMDADDLGLTAPYVVWAGSATQTVTVMDESGAPIDGAVVRSAIVDDLGVAAEGVTVGGSVTFSNVPPRTLIVTGEAAPNRFGTAGALGNGAPVTLIVLGFSAPSNVPNNDFSQGLDGWDVTSGVGDGSVTLIEHEEEVGPDDSDEPKEETPSFGALDTDLDLQLQTGGQGSQRVSRAFEVEPGTRSVTVRYRFVTTEVPGGYYGSEFNDYYGVTVRSQGGGGRSSEQNSMNALGLAAFDASGGTSWREVELPVSEDGDLVQVDLVVANVGDGLFPSRVVVDRVREAPLSIAAVELKDNSLFTGRLKGCHGSSLLEPLQFFSMGTNNTFRNGNTWVWGDLTLEDEPGDAVTDVQLEAVWNGRVVSSGPLSSAARSDLLRAFPSSGRLTTSQSRNAPLFAVPGSEYPARDASITLRVRAETASGQTATRTVGQFPILVLYTGSNRFGSATRDAEQGGDGWARRSAALWGLRVSNTTAGSDLQFNDWANMNGGKFPIHCTHRTGEIADATFPELLNKGTAAAQQLIDILNSSQGSRIQRIQTTYNRSGSFATTVANAETLDDGREASDVIGYLGGHPTHMHVTLVPGGGTANGFNFAARGGGGAWTERGPRGGPARLAARATVEAAPSRPLSAVIAPNPVSGRRVRFLVSSAPNASVQAEVFDAVGRSVSAAAIEAGASGQTPASLDLEGLVPGLYLLRLSSGGESSSQIFVVVR